MKSSYKENVKQWNLGKKKTIINKQDSIVHVHSEYN